MPKNLPPINEVLGQPGPVITKASTLVATEFPPIRWAVPLLIPEGMIVLAGKPKIGKSWLAYSIALAIAQGGCVLGKIEYKVEKGTALMLALEDNQRRLKDRLLQMGHDAPDGLELATEWPPLDEGGLELLARYLDDRPDCRMIVIDTIQRVKPRSASRNANAYEVDTLTYSPLQKLAIDRHIAIVVITHLRKSAADDVFERVTGSTGLTGVADATLVLDKIRNENEAKLSMTGRDVEEHELILKFDKQECRWSLVGDAKHVASTREQQDVLELLVEMDKPLAIAQIAKMLKISYNAARIRLGDLYKDGKAQKTRKGFYAHQDYVLKDDEKLRSDGSNTVHSVDRSEKVVRVDFQASAVQWSEGSANEQLNIGPRGPSDRNEAKSTPQEDLPAVCSDDPNGPQTADLF
jgi:AAA domain